METVNECNWGSPADIGSLTSCRACGHSGAEVFFSAGGVPANSCLLIPSREEARQWPRGDLALAFCPSCGFVFNAAFDLKLTEYSSRYEETQGYSTTFQTFQNALAADLVRRYGLFGRTVLEIGCGKGEFLALLCSLGGNRGLGFDPAFREDRTPGQGRFRVIREFFSDKYAHFRADFVCCKMTLEHVPHPAELVRSACRAVVERPAGAAFFQVPDATRILRDCAFEDIYYEHCSYFAPVSLANLFHRCGFEVLHLQSTFDDQYLTIEARPRRGAEAVTSDGLELLHDWSGRFGERFRRRRDRWRRRLAEMHAAGERVVIWGSGSKGVAFLTALGLDEEIAAVVDINPHRQGCFMAGTGHRIVSPAALRDSPPEAVIIMNAIYREEIRRELADLGLAPALLTLEGGDEE